jgi:exo-beta-1,3-glucanase (GH17 family)
MKFSQFFSASARRAFWLRTFATLMSSALLASCGGGGVGVVVTGVTQRLLSPEMASRNAVNYSPYRTSQVEADRAKELITEAMIKQDLDLMVAGNFRLIRLFDSSDKVAKQTLKVIRDNGLDIKVMLGVWIASGNDAFNQAEIARGVALAKQYSDIVVAVSVGNETMVSWSFNPLSVDQMAAYIKSVRNQVTQPVTTDDNWAFFAQSSGNEKNPRTVLDVIDFVAMHTYPLAETIHPPATWDWQQFGVTAGPLRATAMMDAAIAAARAQHAAVRAHLDSVGFKNMPIVIGETGWKAVASDGEYNRAHPVNQKMYFDRLQTWTAEMRAGKGGPTSTFYFAAFDEPWKGNDDKWGLFDVARHARLVVQALYPGVAASTSPAANNSTAAVFAPDAINTVITANRYSLFANAVVAGETKLAALNWYGWENGVAGWAGPKTGADALVGPDFVKVEPSTKKTWGWGVFISPTDVVPDLSAFASAGILNFSIKTAYTGRLKIGFQSTIGGATKDLFIDVGTSGSYGFARDGAWHSLSIPITAILDANPGVTAASAQAKLATIVTPFVIADTHADNAPNGTEPIYLDEIYWSK